MAVYLRSVPQKYHIYIVGNLLAFFITGVCVCEYVVLDGCPEGVREL
jgi:hypothetical protein